MTEQDVRVELGRLAPAPEVGELAAGRQAELKAEFLRQVERAPRRGAWRRARGWAAVRRPSLGIPVVLAAVVAAAVAVVPAVMREDAGPGSSTVQSAGLTVETVFTRAAARARAAQWSVRPDQYVYVDIRNQVTINGDKEHERIIRPGKGKFDRFQYWMSMDPAKDSAQRYNEEAVAMVGPEGTHSARTDHLLATRLPTDPDQLLAHLRRELQPNQVWEFIVHRQLEDLLLRPVGTPAVQAAILQAAARVPGMELVGELVDGQGRPAVAVGQRGSDGSNRTDWLFDRDTYEFLGKRTVRLATATEPMEVRSMEEIVRRAVVNGIGEVP